MADSLGSGTEAILHVLVRIYVYLVSKIIFKCKFVAMSYVKYIIYALSCVVVCLICFTSPLQPSPAHL